MPDNSLLIVLMVVAIVGLFFMNSRSRKRQAQAVAFRDNLQQGQQVMTSSGMFGSVVGVDGDKVTLVSSGGQESVWLLAAIAKLAEEESVSPDEDESDGDDLSDGGDSVTRYVERASDVSDVPAADAGADGTTTPQDPSSR